MTRQQIALVLERAETWPQEAQDELVRAIADIERRHAGIYRLDEEERADILEGLAEMERGEVADADQVKAVFDKLRNG